MARLPGIKSTIVLFISIFISIWILSGLFFFDRWNRLMQLSEIKSDLITANVLFHNYINYLGITNVNPEAGLFYPAENPEEANIELLALQSSFDVFENSVPFVTNPPEIRKIRTIRENLSELNKLTVDYKNAIDQLFINYDDKSQNDRILRKIGGRDKGGILDDFIIQTRLIENLIMDLYKFSSDYLSDYYKTYRSKLIFYLSISGILIISLLYYFGSILSIRLAEIQNNTKQLKEGKMPDNLQPVGFDDIRFINDNLNILTTQLKAKAEFANYLAEGNYSADFIPAGEHDILGNSLLRLKEKLYHTRVETLKRIEEDNRRSWINEGIAKFGEIFRSERENVTELAYKVILNLVQYIGASAAGIYLAKDDNAGTYFDMVAAYAFDRRKYLQKQIQIGEGLVGTCALEKETIFMTDIREDYLEISSGLGESKPLSLLIVPLKIEEAVFGVLEIASMKVLQAFEITFVGQISEITASTLASVKINEQKSKLLEQSREQTEIMLQQEERMKKSMAQLQKAQDEYLKKESEMTAILFAVNSSSLVAEFTENGRFSNVNDKMQLVLETSKDQIIGKHHSDFAVTDKYSEEYKLFWKNIREGQIINKIERYRLFSGKEVWLEETFSSVIDNDGNIIKILNIASDITEKRQNHQLLEKATNEIERLNDQIKTLQKNIPPDPDMPS